MENICYALGASIFLLQCDVGEYPHAVLRFESQHQRCGRIARAVGWRWRFRLYVLSIYRNFIMPCCLKKFSIEFYFGSYKCICSDSDQIRRTR